MHVRRLALTNFRCFREIDLALPCGNVVVLGDNAQGKSSLLEALYVLATTRPAHAANDRELVHWDAYEDPMPHARLWCEVERDGERDTLEVVLIAQKDGNGPQRMAKRIRLNGTTRRAMDVIGRLTVVLFTPRDLDVVDGGPQSRRRFLDVLLCQTDPRYCRALSRYNAVMARRNQLLRRLRDHGGDRDELPVWDQRLASEGAIVVQGRSEALAELAETVDAIHRDLTGGRASLALGYVAGAAPAMNGVTRDATEPVLGPSEPQAVPEREIAKRLQDVLLERRDMDLARGVTTVGPHRDDVRLEVDGVDARTFGSRGQQRTVALALKLAEAELMEAHTGSAPVMLLDDVLSELDEHRRQCLLRRVDPGQQCLLATTDLAVLTPAFREGSRTVRVRSGAVDSVREPARPASGHGP